MSLVTFFATISSALPDRLLGNLDALARLDPEKFYLENVRSVLGTTSKSAQRICDTAVRQEAFLRFVEVVCPNGSAAASARKESDLPETVRCLVEHDGQLDEVIMPTHDLAKRVFYRLNNEKAARGSRSSPA